jgi:LPS sulfotransferase NodH
MWDAQERAAEYDGDAIAQLLAEIRAGNDAWASWFVSHAVEPLRLAYEALAADPDREARRVLEFLGVEPPARRLEPRVQRMGDARNADWSARFRAVP